MAESKFDRKEHWEGVYRARPSRETSWHQEVPAPSLDMIARCGVSRSAPVIDIGGGASLLADHLLEAGYNDISVLDISAAALRRARQRLGDRAATVEWIEADVTDFSPSRKYALWHDRAAFHFLTDPADRERYVDVLLRALEPGGQAVLATFAERGPNKCSGLEVKRYGRETMQEALGAEMHLVEDSLDRHITPSGGLQQFAFYRFERRNPKI